jgi:molybdate transport system substrate-binding protein
MFDRLGLTEAMASKTVLEQGSTRATARVASGEVELVLTLISEILPVEGVELVGPFPAAVQKYVSFGAGVSAKTGNAEAAGKLLAYLSGPAAARSFKAKGLDPAAGN